MKYLLPIFILLAACGAHEPQPPRQDIGDDDRRTTIDKPWIPDGGPLIKCCMPPEVHP